ncbi:lipopolysaccharide biosynthesis protein [Collinsella sp. LCP19S3_C9]|uniref:lipopolysaccharide biosynthesis protein n=1 Tax=Collinsella sp. LCP19S3_C9 TaxID=3438760 RepID=UPI003F8EB729
MADVSKHTVVTSLAWKFLERGSAQVVSFVVSLVLARLLGPTDYGVVSLVLVFTAIALVFVQGGFNTALIQKEGASELDYSSVLVFSLGMSFAIYIVLFLAAPSVAEFYNNPEVCLILRVMALVLLPGAYNSVQIAYAEKTFQFRKLFVANLATAVCSGAVGIALAFAGAGVWALVAQQLGNQAFVCAVLVFTLHWRPRLGFSLESIKGLFAFGANVLVGNLLVSVFLNLRNLIVGRLFDTSTLGLFNRGHQFPSTVMSAITGSMQEVMLPTFSGVQESPERVLSIARRSVRASCFVIFPLLFGLGSCASTLVLVVLGESWICCVPYLQIFAVSYCFQPIQLITAQAMRGLGDSKTTLKLEIVRKTAEFALMFLSIALGPVALAASSVVAGAVSCAVALVPNVRVLGYSLHDQLCDLLRPLVGSAVMALCVLAIGMFPLPGVAVLAFQILLGAVIYAVFMWLMRDDTMMMLVGGFKKVRSH